MALDLMTDTSVALYTLEVVDNPLTQSSMDRINYMVKYTSMIYVYNSFDSYIDCTMGL